MYVYLISNGTHTKIGMSGNPLSRLAALKTSSWDSLRIDYLWSLPNKETAVKFEVFLHSLFKAYRSSGEWFSIKPDEIADKVSTITLFEKVGKDGAITPHKEALQRRRCEGCGKTYKPVSISQKFCTQTCRGASLPPQKLPELDSQLKAIADKLYPEWRRAVIQGACTHAKAATQRFIWGHYGKGKETPTANEAARIWNEWKARGAKDGLLKRNPKYKPGNRKPEYILS